MTSELHRERRSAFLSIEIECLSIYVCQRIVCWPLRRSPLFSFVPPCWFSWSLRRLLLYLYFIVFSASLSTFNTLILIQFTLLHYVETLKLPKLYVANVSKNLFNLKGTTTYEFFFLANRTTVSHWLEINIVVLFFLLALLLNALIHNPSVCDHFLRISVQLFGWMRIP